MHWLSYATIYIAAFSIKDIFRKRSLNSFDNMAVLSLEFSFTALIFIAVALLLKTPLELNTYTLTFFGIGILHGLGTVGKINAMNISLSKTMLVSKFDVFFPMALGFFLLGESHLLSLHSTEGILTIVALSLFPISLFLLHNPTTKTTSKVSKVWLVSMIQFFFFHATIDFLMKSTVQSDMIIQAGVFQRSAAALVTIVAAVITKAKYPKSRQLFGVSTFNAMLIAISYFSALSALVTAPLIIYKPLIKMSTVIIITLAGLFIFGERKEVSNRNKWGYLVTSIGVIMLIVAEVVGLMG